MTEVETGTARRPRRDVTRNLDALLTAAKEVFATDGVDAPAKRITDRAGVGVGTLYRHFPQRSDLIVAVLTHEVEECIGAAEALTTSGSGDPWTAVNTWIDSWIGFVATKQGLAEALHSPDPAYAGLAKALLHRIEPVVEALLDRGRADGSIRGDVSAYDLMLSASLLCQAIPGRDPDWNRGLVHVFVDGLRGHADVPEPDDH